MCTIYHIFVVMSVLAATLLTRQISANINYYYLLDTKWAEWAKKRSILKWIFNTSVICIVLLLVYVTFNKIMKKQLTTWTLSLSLALCDSFFFWIFWMLTSFIYHFKFHGKWHELLPSLLLCYAWTPVCCLTPSVFAPTSIPPPIFLFILPSTQTWLFSFATAE